MSTLARLYRPLWQGATYRDSLFLLLGLFFGVLWSSVAITLYAVGLGTAIVWIGVPILVLTHRAMRWIGQVERAQVAALLGERLPDLPPIEVREYRDHDHPRAAQFGSWMHAVLHDVYSWRALGWIMTRLITGPIGFALVVVAYVVPISLALSPVALALWPEATVPVASAWWGWYVVGPLLALATAPMFVWAIRGFAKLHRMIAYGTLAPCAAEYTKAATKRAERAEQQVRIDQELHDSIGHMITMNIVQAGAGAHVFDQDPEFARQALRNIEERGRIAMSELDRIIAAIRGDDAEPRAPLPEVADIVDLVAASQAAGVQIDATITDAAVPPALGRAAYGIVREGVTNAAKHAPGAHVHVHVELEADALGVSVVNGPPAVEAAHGQRADQDRPDRIGSRHGLAGIRDRVALLGGRSEAGPTPDGGFRILALLPKDLTFSTEPAYECPQCCPWDLLRDQGAVTA